ncbi:ABC transporter permease [Cellulosilyticum sp. I15G10I2]|uniref:ABC transporter permease n=1 Tax=Cellulosilyticum sp. I15G10I2 TaxID=1892843 RepID=UPI00085C40A3|nr:ABC transporter permease [Cellulosilyticum sp. I15G10I2]
MLNLAQRNLKIFFRQKSTVFFSLLGIFVIIGLYVLFLGNVWIDYIPESLPEARNLMNNWIIAGIVSVASITTAMGAFGTMIEDKVQKTSKDFYSSPIKRSQIVGGYILSALIIGFIICLITFILGETYIMISGGTPLSFISLVTLLGIMFLSVLSSSCLVFFIVSFFESTSAFATASTILGTLVGFLTGIYLPIGTLPQSVQWVIKLFPVSHAGALMRQVMLKEPIATSFLGVPENYITAFKEMMGVTYTYGDYTATALVHILVLIGTAAIFFTLALWNISRKN